MSTFAADDVQAIAARMREIADQERITAETWIAGGECPNCKSGRLITDYERLRCVECGALGWPS